MASPLCTVFIADGVRCIAAAIDGELCAAHVNMRKETYNVKCRLCARTIAAGRWHTYAAEGRSCAPKCKPMKDVKR